MLQAGVYSSLSVLDLVRSMYIGLILTELTQSLHRFDWQIHAAEGNVASRVDCLNRMIDPQMVHNPRRSSLMRPVPRAFLILSLGYLPGHDRGYSRLDGLRLGSELDAMVNHERQDSENSEY